jgi:hypothetical protein
MGLHQPLSDYPAMSPGLTADFFAQGKPSVHLFILGLSQTGSHTRCFQSGDIHQMDPKLFGSFLDSHLMHMFIIIIITMMCLQLSLKGLRIDERG